MSLFWIIIIAVGLLLLWELLDRLLNPWLAKRAVDKLLADVKAGKKSAPRDHELEIIFDSTDFTLLSLKNIRTTPVVMRWNEVHRITAFKRDLFNVDQICLFIARADETGIELDEEMKGWSEFIRALPRFLPSCKAFESWFHEVAFPAFAANPTELYNRTTDSPKEISK